MVTIKDVARKAGVSYTTVSKAINNKGKVNKETEKRIFEAIKELNYVPNKAARNLVSGTNKTVALIASGLTEGGGKDNITYNILAGVYSFEDQLKYPIAFHAINSKSQQNKSYVQFCLEHNFAGVIFHGIRIDDQYFKELIESEIPCVCIDINTQGENMSSISVDNTLAAEEAVDYLISRNHRKIAYMNGRRQAVVALERYTGYLNALKKHNINFDENLVIDGEFLEETAYQKFIEFYDKNKEITAIFCASDLMAIGVLRACRKLKLKVPEDLSIVGFDNIPLSEYTTPRLTTISQNMYQMGRESAQLLKDLLDHDEKKGKHHLLDHKLLERDSVAFLKT